jgi:hypothetical protein
MFIILVIKQHSGIIVRNIYVILHVAILLSPTGILPKCRERVA